MTQEELDAIKARCEAATAGPWHWSGDYPSDAPCPHGTDWTDHGPDLTSSTDPVITSSGYDASSLDVSDADAEFIAAARSDVPALLAEIQRLQDALEEADDTQRMVLGHKHDGVKSLDVSQFKRHHAPDYLETNGS